MSNDARTTPWSRSPIRSVPTWTCSVPRSCPDCSNPSATISAARTATWRLFEIGRVFQRAAGILPAVPSDNQNRQQDAGGKLKEERRVAFALTGQRAARILERGGTRREVRCVRSEGTVVEEFLEQYGPARRRRARKPRRESRHVGTVPRMRRPAPSAASWPLGELGRLLPDARQAIRPARRRVPRRTEPR